MTTNVTNEIDRIISVQAEMWCKEMSFDNIIGIANKMVD